MIRALIKSIFYFLLIVNTTTANDLCIEAQVFYGKQETSNLMSSSSSHEDMDKSINYNMGFCCGRLACCFATDMENDHDSCSTWHCIESLKSASGAGGGFFCIATGLCTLALTPFWGLGTASNACAECADDAQFQEGYLRGTRCYPGDLGSITWVCCGGKPILSDYEFEHQRKIKKVKKPLEKELREEEGKLERAKQNQENATRESQKIGMYKKEQDDAAIKMAQIQQQIDALK